MTAESRDESKPWAWAKLNAYGFVLAGLALLGGADLVHPANTDLARLAGEVPAGQTWWIVGVVLSGLLLLLGFLRTDRVAETAGLVVLLLAITAQTSAAIVLLGWTDFTLTCLAILAIIGGCTWARCDVLWSRDGIAVTIPPRNGGNR